MEAAQVSIMKGTDKWINKCGISFYKEIIFHFKKEGSRIVGEPEDIMIYEMFQDRTLKIPLMWVSRVVKSIKTREE